MVDREVTVLRHHRMRNAKIIHMDRVRCAVSPREDSCRLLNSKVGRIGATMGGGHGVYMLWGIDESGKPRINVGCGDFKQRFADHSKDPEYKFWEYTAVFTAMSMSRKGTSGRKRGAKQLRHQIESALTYMVRQAEKKHLCETHNKRPIGKEASPGSDAHMIMESLQSCLPHIGLDIFKGASAAPPRVPQVNDDRPDALTPRRSTLPKKVQRRSVTDAQLRLKGPHGVDAKGYSAGPGKEFVVLAGSKASKTESPSISQHKHVHNQRKQLRSLGILVDAGAVLEFSRDHIFSAPSTAAGVCLGRGASLKYSWKDASGRPPGA